MNQKEINFIKRFFTSFSKSPIFVIFNHFSDNGNSFLTFIGTIVAITSLLQVPEVRCLAELEISGCLDKHTILLKLCGFFSFIIIFTFFFSCLTIIFDLTFIFIFVKIVVLIKLFIYKNNKTTLKKMKRSKVYRESLVLRYKANYSIQMFYYISIILLSFFISLRITKTITPDFVKSIDIFFKYLDSFFQDYHY